MEFKELYRSDKYYSVGVDDDTGDPVIEVTITGIAWTDYYFRLTPEEFDRFKSDHASLDDLADRMAYDKGAKYFTDRLIRN